MINVLYNSIATFTSPEYIGTNPKFLIWILPLTAAIVLVYKAVKLPKFETGLFIKESFMLFFSIVFLIAIAAAALHIFTRLIGI
jgi:hypothetical protein